MKGYFLVFVWCMGFFLYGCGESLMDSRYTLEFPAIPQNWEKLLGSPYWQVEWLDDQGRKETAIVRGGVPIDIALPQTFASAVLASPFWPDKGLGPGIFRPAGAVFPFDARGASVRGASKAFGAASGRSLVLSWRGGVDANLFWELADAYGAGEARAVARLPWNFNWPRFRELFDDPGSNINGEIRADPWLADWQTIAEKIVKSGFDKRRLVPEPRTSLRVPVGPGPWVGTSPFAAPLLFEDGALEDPVFPVREKADTWVSAGGILRCNAKTWIMVAEW